MMPTAEPNNAMKQPLRTAARLPPLHPSKGTACGALLTSPLHTPKSKEFEQESCAIANIKVCSVASSALSTQLRNVAAHKDLPISLQLSCMIVSVCSSVFLIEQ